MDDTATIALDYREQLNSDKSWALWEGGMFFEGTNKVHTSLRRITRKLSELDVPYAVVGGMALYLHGYRRFTEDVHLLVRPECLEIIHEKLVGLGYLPAFTGSKNLKDTETGVKIEFLVTGQYPGDGLPKPVSFPDPASITEPIDGIPTLILPKLVELKLASGTAEWRQKDLVDVQALIHELQLPQDFAEKLDPSVRPLYLDRWRLAQLGN
jgi:hypothetical protein